MGQRPFGPMSMNHSPVFRRVSGVTSSLSERRIPIGTGRHEAKPLKCFKLPGQCNRRLVCAAFSDIQRSQLRSAANLGRSSFETYVSVREHIGAIRQL